MKAPTGWTVETKAIGHGLVRCSAECRCGAQVSGTADTINRAERLAELHMGAHNARPCQPLTYRSRIGIASDLPVSLVVRIEDLRKLEDWPDDRIIEAFFDMPDKVARCIELLDAESSNR